LLIENRIFWFSSGRRSAGSWLSVDKIAKALEIPEQAERLLNACPACALSAGPFQAESLRVVACSYLAGPCGELRDIDDYTLRMSFSAKLPV
jgi:hypothetical protein